MKKTWYLRLLAMVLTLSMMGVVGALAENFNAEGYPICPETITVTCAGPYATYATDWNTLAETKKIEEKFGIKIDYTNYAPDAWPAQLTMMLTADELPDMLICANMGMDAFSYAADGYFLPLDEYLDYMPNFRALLDENPPLKLGLTAGDGHIYFMGQYVVDRFYAGVNAPVWLNNVWLRNVNMEVPATTDELLDVLRAFRDQDANGNGDPNDEIPLGAKFNWSGRYLLCSLMASFGMFGNGGAGNLDFYIAEDGTVKCYQTTENYREFLKYMRTLYEEKLLDQEFFVMTDAQFTEKREGNVYGVCSYNYWGNDAPVGFDMTVITGLTSPLNAEKSASRKFALINPARHAISANTQYPEVLCRLMDYFFSQDNILEFYDGVRFKYIPCTVPGYEDYYVLDKRALAEENGVEEAIGQASIEEWEFTKQHIQNGWHNFILFNENFYSGFSYDELIKLNEVMLASTPPQTIADVIALAQEDLVIHDAFPVLSYTTEETTERNDLRTAIETYFSSAFTQFVLGNEDIDTGFDSFVKTMNDMGLGRWLEIEQAAYDRVK